MIRRRWRSAAWKREPACASRLSTLRVMLSNGERIAANTVIPAAGVRAHPLTEQIPGERDGSGRVIGDAFLRAPAAAGIFVTGDTVKAATDDLGNHNLMTCQHAMSLGRVAGHNAAAELAGLPTHPYSQPKYVTCTDLGPRGALYTEGWERRCALPVRKAKDEAGDQHAVDLSTGGGSRGAVCRRQSGFRDCALRKSKRERQRSRRHFPSGRNERSGTTVFITSVELRRCTPGRAESFSS